MFSSYDLRGVVPILDERVYYWLGISLVNDILRPDNLPLVVVVGHDCRLTSEAFSQALIQGVRDAGGDPLNLGLCSTDQLYASLLTTKSAGCMVTASHNPSEYNGCKIVKEKSEMLGIGNGLEKVRDFVVENLDKPLPPIQPVVVDTKLREAMEHTLTDVLTKIAQPTTLAKTHKIQKIVVDAGNGSGGQHFTLLTKTFPWIEWVPLFIEPDGNFPNHMPDPTKPKNLVSIKAKMEAVRADLGIAFDGDADRAYFLDENTRFIDGNSLVGLLGVRMIQSVRDGEW